MALPPRLRMRPDQRAALSRVASGDDPADLALTGGQVLNVFTGTVQAAVIGISQGRIAWVRPDGGPAREELDLDGATLVPGLIDAHCHVDMMYTPSAFAEAAVGAGTTMVVADLTTLRAHLDDEELTGVLDALGSAAIKLLWAIGRSIPDDLDPVLGRPDVVGSGELTAWPDLLAGRTPVLEYVSDLLNRGLRIDGHLPGASPLTLARAAAAGLSSDHEAINPLELRERLAAGLWSMVRDSSLRPDATQLAAAIVRDRMPTARMMLTADGLLATDLVRGHVDRVVRAVLAGGLSAVEAVRMATIHPATYLGLDAHVGSLAPGRCADVLAVDSLDTFEPVRVLCDGVTVKPGAAAGKAVDWSAFALPMGAGELTAERIVQVCSRAPAVKIEGVITRLAPETPANPTYLALVTRDGRRISGTTASGLAPRALATTYTGTYDALLAGTDPAAMVQAYRRVVELGGGLAAPGAELALPTFGHLWPGSMDELAGKLETVERAAGLNAGPPPFTFLGMFLTLPALPGVALTPDGLIDVRSGERLSVAESLEETVQSKRLVG